MTKRISTKKALLISGITIFLCLAMFVGSTFAWFTDTATTNVNKIEAGTLDVALEIWDETEKTWVSAEGKTLDFIKADGATEILWEPGCTYKLPRLRIVNNGNLALKFDVVISGINGDAKLNEAIEWTCAYTTDYADYGQNPPTMSIIPFKRTELIGAWKLYPASASDQSRFVNYAYLDISGHMKEDAGNDYQKLSIDGIAVTVYATQVDFEYDSKDPMYDLDAEIPLPSKDDTPVTP